AHLVGRALEEARERRYERHEALRGEARGGADHVLLRDPALHEPIGKSLLELLRVRRVLHVAVQHADAWVALAHAYEGLAVRLPRGDLAQWRLARDRLRRGQRRLADALARTANRRRRQMMQAGLERRDHALGHVVWQRLAVPAFLALDL